VIFLYALKINTDVWIQSHEEQSGKTHYANMQLKHEIKVGKIYYANNQW
jgi:hypothetical protein